MHLYDDRLEVFLGTTPLTTLTRGRPSDDGRNGHAVDCRHVIHALRRKPMALRNPVHRNELFPREACRRAFEALLDTRGERTARRDTAALLSLAHERGCEAALAQAHVNALAAGDGWLDQGANLILTGNPGGGKSRLAAAIGLALVENGCRVLHARTTDPVQRRQVARRELALEAAIRKLDKHHLPILDDIAYVRKDQAETSALFELVSSRCERRSMLVTANQPFGEWGSIFPDEAMTLAAVDRLVHRATIFELNVESHRRRTAVAASQKTRRRGRCAALASATRSRTVFSSSTAAAGSPAASRRTGSSRPSRSTATRPSKHGAGFGAPLCVRRLCGEHNVLWRFCLCRRARCHPKGGLRRCASHPNGADHRGIGGSGIAGICCSDVSTTQHVPSPAEGQGAHPDDRVDTAAAKRFAEQDDRDEAWFFARRDAGGVPGPSFRLLTGAFRGGSFGSSRGAPGCGKMSFVHRMETERDDLLFVLADDRHLADADSLMLRITEGALGQVKGANVVSGLAVAALEATRMNAPMARHGPMPLRRDSALWVGCGIDARRMGALRSLARGVPPDTD